MRSSQVSPIYQVFNDLPSSTTYEDGKIPSAGTAWCITEIYEIHEMEIHVFFMCICLGL